jgi:hypothetical protein
LVLTESIGEAGAEAVGLEAIAGFSGNARRAGPELVLIFGAEIDSASEPVVEAAPGGDGEIAAVSDLLGEVDSSYSEEDFGIGAEFSVAKDIDLGPCKVVVFVLTIEPLNRRNRVSPSMA